jgi:hypothetical protein
MVRVRLAVTVLALWTAGCGNAEREVARDSSGYVAVSGTENVVAPQTVTRSEPLVDRLLIFALDGATWDLIDPLLEDGALPNLQHLLRNGVRAELETIEPTVSPAIWTTIATGVLPDEHGIHGFDGVPGLTMKTLPNSRMRNRKTFWNILSDFEIRTGTVGWWATWPADPLTPGSFLISDRVPYTRMEAAIHRAALDPGDIYPAALEEVIVPQVARPNDISPEVVERFLHLSHDEMKEHLLDVEYRMGSFLPEFKFVYQSDSSTVRMALAAWERHPVDVLSVYLTGIDTVSHLYWHFAFPDEFPRYRIPSEAVERFGDVIALYYGQVDAWLGELLKAVEADATVMVISDHGFGGTGELPWSGGHGRITPGAPVAPPGILVLSGPGTVDGPRPLESAHVLDVTPTILRMLGLPRASNMSGRVLLDALDIPAGDHAPDIESYEVVGSRRTIEPVTVDPSADEERLERLRALGYLQ